LFCTPTTRKKQQNQLATQTNCRSSKTDENPKLVIVKL
jgi:hypothetical protein